MSPENADNSNLPEVTKISSNQHVKKQFKTPLSQQLIVVNVNLRTPTEQQAVMSSNTDKLTNTFYDQLTHVTSVLKHNVNVEQNSRGSTSTSSQEVFSG